MVALSQPPNLFALVIGINKYQSSNIPSLMGAVPDADAVQDYLQKYLGVPNAQISNLRDAEATQAAIIDAINALTTDARIQRGDPILIFFAGHGSAASNPVGSVGWERGETEIQPLVPYDYLCQRRKVYGMPDVTFGTLLGRLAAANIRKLWRIISGDMNPQNAL